MSSAGNLIPVVLSALLAACGGGPTTCYLEGPEISVSGDLGKLTCEDLEVEAEAFRRAFDGQVQIDQRFSDAWEHVKGIEVHLRPGIWSCGPAGCFAGQANCWTAPRYIDLSSDYPRAGLLVHELAHIAQDCVAWPLEGGDPYPGGNRVEYGHEGWVAHGVFSQIDYATRLMQ